MNPIPRKLGLSFGLVAVLLFSVLYATAMSIDDQYVFYTNYLSDLGVGPGGWAFNSAVMLAGVFMVLFSVSGLRRALPHGFASGTAVALLALSGALLFNVGVFTEDSGGTHTAVSVAFFLVLLLSMGATTLAMYRSRPAGWTGLAVSAAAFAFGLSILPMGANPQSETLAVLAAMAWGAVTSALLLAKDCGYRAP